MPEGFATVESQRALTRSRSNAHPRIATPARPASPPGRTQLTGQRAGFPILRVALLWNPMVLQEVAIDSSAVRMWLCWFSSESLFNLSNTSLFLSAETTLSAFLRIESMKIQIQSPNCPVDETFSTCAHPSLFRSSATSTSRPSPHFRNAENDLGIQGFRIFASQVWNARTARMQSSCV